MPVGSPGDIVSSLRKKTITHDDAIDQLRILSTVADAAEIARISFLIDDLRKDAAAEKEPARDARVAGALAGLPMGGECSATWRAARRLTLFTLHVTGPETAHTVKWDASSGSTIADVPATKPIADGLIFICILFHFRHAAVEAALLTEADLHELCTFVSERMYTRSRTEAIECTVRKMLYTLDTDTTGTLTLASLVQTRAPTELQAEECRYAALSGRSGPGSKSGSSARGSGSGSAPAKAAKGPAKGSHCFNWSKGSPCASAHLTNGVCRFDHICGKDLGNGDICRAAHRQSEHG